MSATLDQMLIQPSPLGEVFAAARDVQGPTSYTTGGITVAANGWGMLTLKCLLSDHLSQDGLYYARFIMPRGSGAATTKMVWYSNYATAPSYPIALGTLSAAATASVMTANGVVTVSTTTPPPVNSFVLLTNGATNKGIFLNGAIVQVTSVVAGTSYSFNFAAAKSLTYSSSADTLKWQLLQAAPNNPVQLGSSVAVSAVAVASNVLTVTCVNTANTIVPGNFVVIQGLAAGEVPQGAIVQVLTTSTTQFTANIIAPNLSATSGETATATVLVTNGNAALWANDSTYSITGTTVAATAASATAAGAVTVLPVQQSFTPGMLIVIQGLTHGAALNGLITPVLAASLSAANVTTNGYIATAVTTGTADLGTASILSTGSPANGDGEAIGGANLSSSYIRVVALGN